MGSHQNEPVDLGLESYKSFLKISRESDKLFVYDPIRKKKLVLQPEEWVRQLLVNYLHIQKKYALSRMAAERALSINGRIKRFDLIIFDKQGKPRILVECKSFDTPLTERAALQAAEYNTVLQCPYLILTNGMKSFVCAIDLENKTTSFLRDVPIPD